MSKVKEYLCIGGPLHGQRVTTDKQPDGYDQFNCAQRWPRTAYHHRFYNRKGIVVPETMVFLWEGFFDGDNHLLQG